MFGTHQFCITFVSECPLDKDPVCDSFCTNKCVALGHCTNTTHIKDNMLLLLLRISWNRLNDLMLSQSRNLDHWNLASEITTPTFPTEMGTTSASYNWIELPEILLTMGRRYVTSALFWWIQSSPIQTSRNLTSQGVAPWNHGNFPGKPSPRPLGFWWMQLEGLRLPQTRDVDFLWKDFPVFYNSQVFFKKGGNLRGQLFQNKDFGARNCHQLISTKKKPSEHTGNERM